MKKYFELIAPCHFGMEAVLKKEIIDLGYEISLVEDGRVTFLGDDEAICRANVFLRTAERVLLKVGCFRAETFEELFQGTKAIPWEEYIPQIIQPFRYPADHEKGHGGADEAGLRHQPVPGNRKQLSAAGIFIQRSGDCGNRYFW